MGYIRGRDREQVALFPGTLEEYVGLENVVRFIDAFVEGLEVEAMGFERAQPAATGRPGYDPRDLLKLYIYGYLQGIRSSRKLEREAQRNVEVLWLLRELQPDFKTIADFRRDHPQAFKKVFRQFHRICEGLELFGKELVALDGSKFKGVNSRDRNFNKAKLKKRLERLEQELEEYLGALEAADRDEAEAASPTAEELQEKIDRLQERQGRYEELLEELETSGETQVSLTDPDSRAMPKSPRVPVGYNVQTAVDSRHKLIVEHAVTNAVTDRSQLSAMATKVQEILGVETLEVVADRGYYYGVEIKACRDRGILPYVPKPDTFSGKKRGLFGKELFRFDPSHDHYICPAGEELTYRYTTTDRGQRIRFYWAKADRCAQCALRTQCTPSREPRRIRRWEHEEVLEEMQERMAAQPEKIQLRKALVEHPFGTMKTTLGAESFLLRGLSRVGGEFSLTALAYNLKRVVNLVGVPKLLEAVA